MSRLIIAILLLIFNYSVVSSPGSFEFNGLLLNKHYKYCPIKANVYNGSNFKQLLISKNYGLSEGIRLRINSILKCVSKKNIQHKPILTVIDFSLLSSKKRLWIFDLKKNKLLFNTYVSHGINSGILKSHFFSNINNSRSTSLGVYKTGSSYYGRYGLALKLDGLEQGFNDNANRRAIVMHGGWYVEEDFVDNYGRTGRSWGCPAVPLNMTQEIINTIKDDSLFIAYYPSKDWLLNSKFLNCENLTSKPPKNFDEQLRRPTENRSEIFYVEKNGNNSREMNEPIIVMDAQGYQELFDKSAPVKRMLRRPFKNSEYVALNHDEFNHIINNRFDLIRTNTKETNKKVLFVIPYIKNIRGYSGTEFKEVSLGNIIEVSPNKAKKMSYTLRFKENPPLKIEYNTRFIRWLGL